MSINPLDLLLPEPLNPDTFFRWGVVTSADPLEVALDNDEGARIAEPSRLVSVAPGDRVMVLLYKRRATILGVGAPPGPVWQSYSPILMTTGSPQPTGVDSLGRFLRVGGICHIEVQTNFPSGWTSSGSGYFQMNLPLTPVGYSSGLRGILNGTVQSNGQEMHLTATVESASPVMTRIRRLTGSTYAPMRESTNTDLAGGRWHIIGSYRV